MHTSSFMFILQMMSLRHKEIKHLAYNHTALNYFLHSASLIPSSGQLEQFHSLQREISFCNWNSRLWFLLDFQFARKTPQSNACSTFLALSLVPDHHPPFLISSQLLTWIPCHGRNLDTGNYLPGQRYIYPHDQITIPISFLTIFKGKYYSSLSSPSAPIHYFLIIKMCHRKKDCTKWQWREFLSDSRAGVRGDS